MHRRLLLLTAALCAVAPFALARDRAVLVYPRERAWLRAPVFYSAHQVQLIERLRGNYEVDVHEQVATASDLFSVDVAGATLLVISGHGDPFSLSLAGRSRTLDSTDRMRLETFFARLAPDATIVLQSCYTGRGFAHVVKEAAGASRHVIAARGEIPRDGVEITSVEPFDVSITCRDERGREWDCKVRL